MSSALVCCSSGIKLKLIADKLAALNCIYENDMNMKTVNVLIVGKVGSHKHICALNHGIPCVNVCNLLCPTYVFNYV